MPKQPQPCSADRSTELHARPTSSSWRPAPIAMAASAVALQVALGVPLFVGAYLRSAYAATSCSYGPSGNISPSTSIDCTIASGSTGSPTQAQMLYSGARLLSTSGDTVNGLGMTVTNQTAIALSGTPQSWTMSPYTIPGQNKIEKTGIGALYVGSRGSTNTPSAGGVAGGNGGALTLKNYGDIAASSQGYGIFVYSAGGAGSPKTSSSTQPAGAGGSGGDIIVGLYGTTSIAAGTLGGPAVFAASIGGTAGGDGDYGLGGSSGSVSILVSGTQTITSGASFWLSGEDQGSGALQSGAGIAGVSRAGQSAFNANGSNADAVSLGGVGTLNVTTSAEMYGQGVYLLSEGGTAQNGGGGAGANCGGNCTGGAAGAVSIGSAGSPLTAALNTNGNVSPAIVAQSIGGAGATGLKRNGKQGNVASGGEASSVSIYLSDESRIQTTGTSAHGIVGQSLGAGGGLYSTDATYIGDQNSSSAGGDSVTIHSQGTILVSGDAAYGILAQSIGGAGGSVSASATDTVTVGGQSSGVHGNSVSVSQSGTLLTGNRQSGSGTGGIGILAQSIGGGGGNATSAGPFHFGQSGSTGGSGSNGGAVLINLNKGASGYNLKTYAMDAPGVQAQSIGGGGGNGRNKSGLFSATGGTGGPGGTGGSTRVNLNNGTNLATYGDYSDGLLLQSIGGGGGSGGKATSWGTVISHAQGGSGGSGGAGGEAYAALTSAALTTLGLQAQGIVVQSIGGGGGSGGASKANAAGVLTIAHAHGGSGGGGGEGGEARASIGGGITTYGYDSTAVVVQSIGGGGANGASSAAHAFAFDVPIPDTDVRLGAALSFATGGSGGSGGDGGSAYAVNANSNTIKVLQHTVYSSANGQGGTDQADGSIAIAQGTQVQGISTFGDGATGMLVQSIGGGGGNGGDSTALASAGVLQEKWDKVKQKAGAGDDDGDGGGDDDSQAFNFALSVSHGGGGGGGGNGGSATGLNKGVIATYGLFADGIIVQSIGGGGGNGGSGNAKSNSAGYGVSFSHALGGYGSAGGAGGTALGGNVAGARIQTTGNNARGILVQSIGGGGGNAGGGAGTSDATFGLTLAHGHSGSSGGNGGNAYAYNQGSIITVGDAADGILVQSIGGGGGNGGAGDSSLTVPNSSQFNKLFSPDDSTSDATTDEASDAGKNAQSTTPDTFTLSLGASGGTGGHGRAVRVGFAPGQPIGSSEYTPNGTIQTSGTLAHGIVAQSIGGGGGNAAASSGSSSATMNLYLGASGGDGGYGQDVKVFANDISTSGFSSHGIVAQSIGGGGGTGVASGISKTVTTKLGTKTLNPQGTATPGSSGNGSVVNVYSVGRIVTGNTTNANATDAFGILAQSIGGGGGMAAAAQGSSSAASGQGGSNSIGVSLGAEGLTGDGAGAGVYVNHSGGITTYGTRNMGIVAQSIGGGGGIQSAAHQTLSAVSFNTPQLIGNANTNGGDVTVSFGAKASIITAGDGAIGILAQSVGGGGGFAADASQAFFPVTGTTAGGSSGGYGGKVTVTTASGSKIQTSGYNAHGIFAQTVSGGGGVWDNGSGTSAGSLQGPNATAVVNGPIDITVGGGVAVTGGSAWGIWAQSAGAYNGANPIQVTIDASASVSGSGQYGGAIWVWSQGANLVTNNGTLSGNVQNQNHATTASPTPWAALNERLFSIDEVPQTSSQFINNGVFESGDFVSGITLTNNGVLDVGGSGTLQTTRFDHHLVGSGQIRMDIDQASGQADRIDVVGAISPGPAGQMQVAFNVQSLVPGVDSELLRAGVLDPGALSLVDPFLYDFSLLEPSEAGGWNRLSVQPNFEQPLGGAPDSLRQITQHLTQAWGQAAAGGYDPAAGWGAGPTMIDLFSALGRVTDADGYRQQVEALSASTVMGQLSANVLDALGMANSALDGCATFGGPGSALRQQECVWADVRYSEADQDAERGTRGYDRTATQLNIGGQKQLTPNWLLGLNLAYQDAQYRSHDRVEDLDTTSAGGSVALTYQLERWRFSGALGGGTVWGDGHRRTALGSQPYVATASPSSDYLFARARAAYEWSEEDYYIIPRLDLDLIQVELDDYRESGAGALSLAVEGQRETLFAATPAVEVGARIDRGGLVIRPYGSAGVSLLSTDELSTRARLVGAPGTAGFKIDQPIPDVLGHLRLGANLQSDKGLGVSLEYDLTFGDGYEDQAGYLELSYRF